MKNVLEDVSNDIRVLSLRMTTSAQSGHPTSCLSCAEILAVLFSTTLHYDPSFPDNIHNDRFILSKGHAAPALYAIYALSGWIDKTELKMFRQLNSRLEGHPTRRLPWVDVNTGSLGQGLGVGLGMSLGLLDISPVHPKVYVVLGDGELAEGSVWETMAIASKYTVPNLVAIVDLNTLGQSGESLFNDDVGELATRAESFGWKTQVVNGHEVAELQSALEIVSTTNGPHMIIAKTIKGKGVSFLENKPHWHGKPLSEHELKLALEQLKPYGNSTISVKLPPLQASSSLKKGSRTFSSCPQFSAKVANKYAFGVAIADVASQDSQVVVIDADVKNSTETQLCLQSTPKQFLETYIAEQTMVEIATGLDVVGKRPIISTFASFLTRAFDQLRMASLSERNMIVNGSYCGSSIGKDGSSQMGLEDIAMMRTLPTSTILYPSDAYSAYALTIQAYNQPGIVYIRTTREPTPIVYSATTKFPIGGSHIHAPTDRDQVTIVAAGITLFEALKAQLELRMQRIYVRVIDMYSIKPLDEKTLLYSVQKTNGKVVVVEDHRKEGGMGEAIQSFLSENEVSFTLKHLAVQGISHSATPQEELSLHGIDSSEICAQVKKLL